MGRPEDIVEFFGQRMTRDWAEHLKAAQDERSYICLGRQWQRIPFGDETHLARSYFATGICRHCKTIIGKLHEPECDLEQCPVCGGGAMSCDCEYEGHELLGDDG